MTEQTAIYTALKNLLEAVEERPELRKSIESVVIGDAHAALNGITADSSEDDRQAFEAAYVEHMNTQAIAKQWGQRDYTVAEIAEKRDGEFYNIGIGHYSGYLNGCWWGWQQAHRIEVMAREQGFKDCRDAIIGVISFGKQDVRHPPAGHWLTEFWNIGRQLSKKTADDAAALLEARADRLEGRQKRVPAVDAHVVDVLRRIAADIRGQAAAASPQQSEGSKQ